MLLTIFLSLLGEGGAVMASFLFETGLLASFNFNLESKVWIFPLVYSLLFFFNKIIYNKNKKIIGIVAMAGTIFLFAGLFIPEKFVFIFLSLSGLLLYSLIYRVFNYEIPKELERRF
jgi:hypothetical protein